MNELLDWRGTPIDEGATIVYPGRSGSALWMVEAKVDLIEYKEYEYGYRKGRLYPVLRVTRAGSDRSKAGTSRITAVDRVTVVT